MFILSQVLILFDEKEKVCPLPMCAKFRKNPKNKIVMIAGAKSEIRFLFVGLKNLRSNEFITTETELIAIARPANSGLRTSHNVANAQAAIGIPKVL